MSRHFVLSLSENFFVSQGWDSSFFDLCWESSWKKTECVSWKKNRVKGTVLPKLGRKWKRNKKFAGFVMMGFSFNFCSQVFSNSFFEKTVLSHSNHFIELLLNLHWHLTDINWLISSTQWSSYSSPSFFLSFYFIFLLFFLLPSFSQFSFPLFWIFFSIAESRGQRTGSLKFLLPLHEQTVQS